MFHKILEVSTRKYKQPSQSHHIDQHILTHNNFVKQKKENDKIA